MARYHVRADGSMGVCTAKEGNCPFGGEEGTKHFTSESEARSYSEKIVAEQSRSSKGLKRSNGGGGSDVPPNGSSVGYADSPYNKWASVPDPAPNADNMAEEFTKDMGLTKLPDPNDPMTKARHHIMRELRVLDSNGHFGGPSYYDNLHTKFKSRNWHYLHENPETIVQESGEVSTLDLEDVGLGDVPKEDVTINDLPFGYDDTDMISDYYNCPVPGGDKTLMCVSGVQLHRDGTGTYWKYSIDLPEDPDPLPDEYEEEGDVFDEKAYNAYVESFWEEYNPMDHIRKVTFDASSPEAIDKFIAHEKSISLAV